jgi:dTDP-4-amino-4,6-dideoxygalactose transaminase
VRSGDWPQWPRITSRAERLLNEALHSGRWTVSGPYTGTEPFERRFSEAFAGFNGVEYCVPTCHGSSALMVGLRALGVGSGSEVLVPGITWVACASAVAAVGGRPVLVDIEPDTLCMSVEAAEAAITDATAAILLVHLFCSAADLDSFVELSARHGIPLLEDCSQAHGAIWRHRRVGSFGSVGAFSFQQTKLLTSGEGGAVVCSDPDLYDRMQQYRADGRRYVSQPKIGMLDLEQVGAVQGHNHCLSEFHAALLLEGLERLDQENEIRLANARYLATILDDVAVLDRPDGLERESYYRLCLRIETEAFEGTSVEWIAEALGAELGTAAEPVYDPLNAHPLYNPLATNRLSQRAAALLDPAQFDLPVAASARECHLTLPNQILLGDESDMDDVAEAFSKLKEHLRHRPAERGLT